MKFWKYKILAVALTALTLGCSKDPSPPGPPPEDGVVQLRIIVSAPSIRYARLANEDALNDVTLLVFEDIDGTMTYRYAVEGYSLGPSATEDTDYQFLARLIPSDNELRIWMVANAGSSLDPASPGMTEQEVKDAVTMAYGAGGFTDVLPMSGAIDFPSGLVADTTVDDAVLVRSVARVDVINSADNFVLNSVRVYRANNLVQVIPDVMTNNTVSVASVPAGSDQSVNTIPETAEGNIAEQIYIPESAVPSVADRRLGATAVVVGGYYNGSTTETFYRMDFLPADDNGNEQLNLFGQVLRNHLYRFDIQNVLAAGWLTDDDASQYPSTGVDVEVKVWDEYTMDIVFDDYDYLGVSRRSVLLSYPAGVSATVHVDTSLDSYVAYWGDEDGAIDQSAGPIVFGGDLDDPDGLYNAALSADGTQVVFTSLRSYDAAAMQAKYLVLVAGRLRITISVSQGPPAYGDRPVSIFGSTRELGSLGLYGITSGWGTIPRERARGLGAFLNGPYPRGGSPNFGPGKIVDMRGFNVSGVSLTNSMPAYYYEPFDILYLAYADNPPQTEVDQILAWLEADTHRVLIVHYDNGATNSYMMSALGFSGSSIVTANQVVRPYSYAGNGNVPDFIRTGPFGNITSDFEQKCADTTYGTVDPATADALGFLPVYLGNSTYNGNATAGYYAMAVNPERRIVICGDVDFYSNDPAGSTGYYLNLFLTSYENSTFDPGNPSQVVMGNLWAWIVDVVLRED